jgi:hypothetical protein
MTNLPATMVETEALQFAREWIVRFRDGTNPWSNDSALTADAGRAVTRHLMRQSALLHPINRLQLIAMARAGDTDARDVLRTVMIEIQSRGEPMPTELVNYNMELLHGGLHQPPGPKRKDKLLRDLCIAMTVAAVHDRFGLSPTRNTASRGRPSARPSACSVVAEALALAHMGLGKRSEKAVEAIWSRLGRTLPTVSGWASS